MWVSARQAAEILAEAGLSRRGAVKLLDAGLAGTPVRTSTALLYEEARVRDLLCRPPVGDGDLGALCPDGLFIARRDVQVTAPLEEQRDALAGGWRMSPWRVAGLRLELQELAPLPFIATIRGHIVLGATIVDVTGDPARPVPTENACSHGVMVRLGLADPGSWYDALAGGRLIREPNGPWEMRGWGGRPFVPWRFPPWANHTRRRPGRRSR